MKMSSFNARWSVLLVLFAGTMLLIAGCSSPTGSTTGSDTGGGASTITITGTAGPNASDFDREYPVSGIFRSDPPEGVVYFFCLESPNSISRVSWELTEEGNGWVVPQFNGPGGFNPNSDHTVTTAESLPPLVEVGENMNFKGSAETTGLVKGEGDTAVDGFNFEFVFDINEMPVTERNPDRQPCS